MHLCWTIFFPLLATALTNPWRLPSPRTTLLAATKLPPPGLSKHDRMKSKLKSAGEAGALTYAFASVVWYSVGVPIVLAGLPDPTDLSQNLAGDAVRRCATAWGLCFAASQITTVLKVTAAIAMSPITSRVLSRLRREGSPFSRPAWLAPAVLTVASFSIFGAVMAYLVFREYNALLLLRTARGG